MKIAMVFDGMGTGGIERVGINFCNILLELGHSVDIYNVKPSMNRMESLYSGKIRIFHKAINIYQLPDQYFLILKRWWWGKYLYPVLYFFSTVLLYLYRLTMGVRKKYDLAVAFSGHFADLNFVSRNFIKSQKKLCWLHGSIIEYLVTASTYGDQYRKIKNLIVLSESNQHSALSLNTFLQDLHIHQLYNPIRLEDISSDVGEVERLKQLYGDFLFMAARFEMDKDQDSVIKAYKILKERYHVRNRLLFGGDGSRLTNCKNLAKSLGLGEEVVFLGNLTNIADYYSAAKIYVHSSPAEGLPTVLLEAMKYKVPIVATKSLPGVEEILCGNQYGVQCSVGNPEDIAEKIYGLLSDETLQKHYISMGSERIRDFDYELVKNKLDDIIKHLN